uniref:Protein phosphatase 1 regulatory subunit 11 n=3 Tax=Noccaea caerulescens TaxID=107243 RepID=A0A1J3JS16_NOCCA
MSTATRPSSSATTSVILETPIPQSQPTERLVLRLNRKKKTVSWKDGTVDNEFMQKKSSKKCCIFHKQKPFDEDDSEEEDNNDHHHHHDHDHNHQHSESGEASSSNDSKPVD